MPPMHGAEGCTKFATDVVNVATDVAQNVYKETIRVYEKGVSHRNTNKSRYPRREVDVPVPKFVVAICTKNAFITNPAFGNVS